MTRTRSALGLAASLALASAAALAQGMAPGGPVGGSTAIGSGLGGVTGTGPSWPNGTNQAPQPSVRSVPPGGSASPAPSSTYTTPQPSRVAPSTVRPSPPNQPSAASSVRPSVALPLVLPETPNGSLVFLEGCWRTDIFADGPRKATLTWCFDDRGSGRYLYTRTDRGSLYCHGLARARWNGPKLALTSANPSCDDHSTEVPGALTCSHGTDGALCSGVGVPTVRLYRVR